MSSDPAPNTLYVPRAQFRRAMRRFRDYTKSKRPVMALIAYSDGFLSFEAQDEKEVVAVRADGNWEGAAFIPAYFLAILHGAPPAEHPVRVHYKNGMLQISTLTMSCTWQRVSTRVIQRSESPDPLELLALDRTVSRAEVHGTPLGRKIAQARRLAAAAVTRAAKSLKPFGIEREEIADLVERQIEARVKKG